MTYHSPPWIEKKVGEYEKAVNRYIKTVRNKKSKPVCDRNYECVKELYIKIKDAEVKIPLFKRMH